MSKLNQYRDRSQPKELNLTWYEDAAVAALIWGYCTLILAGFTIPILVVVELVKLILTGHL